MKIYDISMRIAPEMPVYKNYDAKKPVITVQKDHSTGDSYESAIFMNLHTGTHIDAPLHMIEGGDTLDKLRLNQMITKCTVIDLSTVSDRITVEDLANKNIGSGDFVILKTRNSFEDKFIPEFVYLDRTGAGFLRDRKVFGVGIDSLGIERAQPDRFTHKILFKAGITILEGLRLKDIDEGEYVLLAAPLKIEGVEAAPVRAVLFKGIQIELG